MNNPKIIYLIVWLYMLPFMSLSQQDAMASDTKRWGVTTNKKLDKNPSTSIDHTGLEADQDQPNRKDATSPDGKSENQPDTVVKGTGKGIKPNQPNPPSNNPAPQADVLKKPSLPSHKTKMGEKSTKPTTKDAPSSTKAMLWDDEHQKMKCKEYITDLRKWFLKTRHYSIQGAACQTKEYAAAFLHAKDKCTRDCPQGFLSQNGYTDRIVRNITYLEKLGKDRCETKSTSSSMPMPQPK